MPTLSPHSAPSPFRVPAPSESPFTRRAKGTVAIAIIIIGLTTVSCGSYVDPGADASTPVSQEQCVSAVYDVLAGMVAKPNDDQPFDNFVSRYGTGSPTYVAYQDSFDPFYNDAVAHGIKTAEQDVRTTVTKDCAGPN